MDPVLFVLSLEHKVSLLLDQTCGLRHGLTMIFNSNITRQCNRCTKIRYSIRKTKIQPLVPDIFRSLEILCLFLGQKLVE